MIFSSNHFLGSSKGVITTGLPFQTLIIEIIRRIVVAIENKPAPVYLLEMMPPKVSSMLMAVIPSWMVNA